MSGQSQSQKKSRARAPESGPAKRPTVPKGAKRLPVRGGDRKPARVRPYSLTGGRTRFGHVLLVETFVAVLEAPAEQPRLAGGSAHMLGGGGGSPHSKVMPEMRAIVELCRRMRTVAEIAALLKMPLGVVRVLLSDLADQGKIRVYGTGHGPGQPDRALLERVLSGLRRL
ncbi:DUF742 domain-containing protein [Streptomyces europaeiscabiei]|uniref:DUF742 domain-containing protein n=1 Tax=Streptomyces europaeiscabiei TaxID=146819 RepID=A0ABU4NPB5_9ACTN|nr:DUF742 domain-containing protein [Streptomyces europaeiscabiei]MDX2773026.1 DUF742 domain-containing protein [Streptomyces europaeiscabiei]MDX3548243.1 DUF742 domain-containing protein [Streptomyces europaeiscabiei]MDX3557251.1 DUF742 domain-containing protein [Streptomyces europaeiscabiei]MDX3704958.1 DUF742 domain-containing protein [Streptomyces europaeiscabiei]MDX3839438.1 DUF742 domain-containing protein [Streptomyces europaeiscabiei]